MIEETEQEAIERVIRELGVSEAEARFIVAIERGEIDGDEVIIQPGEPLLLNALRFEHVDTENSTSDEDRLKSPNNPMHAAQSA
jgi:hypothetical protein